MIYVLYPAVFSYILFISFIGIHKYQISYRHYLMISRWLFGNNYYSEMFYPESYVIRIYPARYRNTYYIPQDETINEISAEQILQPWYNINTLRISRIIPLYLIKQEMTWKTESMTSCDDLNGIHRRVAPYLILQIRIFNITEYETTHCTYCRMNHYIYNLWISCKFILHPSGTRETTRFVMSAG